MKSSLMQSLVEDIGFLFVNPKLQSMQQVHEIMQFRSQAVPCSPLKHQVLGEVGVTSSEGQAPIVLNFGTAPWEPDAMTVHDADVRQASRNHLRHCFQDYSMACFIRLKDTQEKFSHCINSVTSLPLQFTSANFLNVSKLMFALVKFFKEGFLFSAKHHIL